MNFRHQVAQGKSPHPRFATPSLADQPLLLWAAGAAASLVALPLLGLSPLHLLWLIPVLIGLFFWSIDVLFQLRFVGELLQWAARTFGRGLTAGVDPRPSLAAQFADAYCKYRLQYRFSHEKAIQFTLRDEFRLSRLQKEEAWKRALDFPPEDRREHLEKAILALYEAALQDGGTAESRQQQLKTIRSSLKGPRSELLQLALEHRRFGAFGEFSDLMDHAFEALRDIDP